MGRLGSHAVYASPGQSPARTKDSLPAVGQTLPGGLDGPLGPSERFRVVPYISPPFPGFPWRKRASVRPTECNYACDVAHSGPTDRGVSDRSEDFGIIASDPREGYDD